MKTCETCNTALLPLFTGEFCPNNCDKLTHKANGFQACKLMELPTGSVVYMKNGVFGFTVVEKGMSHVLLESNGNQLVLLGSTRVGPYGCGEWRVTTWRVAT